MSTVIFRAYTEDGFVIGSDGRALECHGGGIETENEQKVFWFGDLTSVAFSFLGSVELFSGDRLMFSFSQAFSLMVASTSYRGLDLVEFANEISAPVLMALRECRLRGRVHFDAPAGSNEADGYIPIADVLLDGYFNGVPQQVDICFSHLNQEARARVLGRRIIPQETVCGSRAVTLAFESSPEFEQYRMAQMEELHQSPILSHSINRAKNMIAAQGSDEARRLDSRCHGMGGRTQIATITPGVGFQWVRGYEPISPSFPSAS